MSIDDEPFFKHLDTVGDGSGSRDMAQDFSDATGAGKTTFKLVPAANELLMIRCLLLHIQDAGTFDASLYGNGVALTNGILLQKTEEGELVQDLLDNDPVTNNGEWASHAYDWEYISTGAGDNVAVIRWSICQAGAPLLIHGNSNQAFEMVLHDNFSGLSKHHAAVHGTLRKIL